MAAVAVLTVGAAACSSGDDKSSTSSRDTTIGSDDPSATSGPGTTLPGGGSGGYKLTEVAVLDEPIVLLSRPGDSDLWAAEKTGRVRRLTPHDDGTLTPDGEAMLDLSEEISTDAEQGLLGMAFSNDGATLYVSYTDADGTSQVVAYEVADTEDGPMIDDEEPTVLLTQTQPFPNHNGGHLLVDSQGRLWFGLGDGGAGDDPDNNAQDPDSLLGKLLRIDLSGDENHEIVAMGLRNPWRFAIDPVDQVMWIADVGQNAIEEVNRTPLSDLEGANFGWSGYEGPEAYMDEPERRPDDPVMPVFSFRHDGQPGGCSVTGGVVYRGTRLADLDGAYFVSDYCGGWVHALLANDDGTVRDVDLGLEAEQVGSFGSDADGNVYVLSQNGPVLRIDPA